MKITRIEPILINMPLQLEGHEIPMSGGIPRREMSALLLRVETDAGPRLLYDWLAEKLASLGHMLHAGDVVLSGALGPVCPVSSGDHIEVEISGLGTAWFCLRH